MTTLVVGASGATGRLLVGQLLKRKEKVKVIVRSPDKLPAFFHDNDNVTVIQASLLELSNAELARHANGCEAVASCLGHNLSIKGLFGHPRRLVSDAVRRLCDAIKANTPEAPVKFVLMNSTANSNRDLSEKMPFAHKCIIWLFRILLPPHADNENAADYLRTEIGLKNGAIEWTAVRPDSLINEKDVSEFVVYPSPIRNPIFDAGKTSRINVGSFMADLITDHDSWAKWKGQMPVIYNKI